LERSGLSQEQVAAAGLYSLSDPYKAAQLLGRKSPLSKHAPFLAFPFRDPETWKLNGYVRLKPDRPRKALGTKVKYESPIGQPNRPFFPPGVREALADPKAALIFTEGEKKS
jgi:putative DNA primase/helicase